MPFRREALLTVALVAMGASHARAGPEQPGAASAEAAESAKEQYQRGLDRLKVDDLRGAAEAFAAAYRLEPNREVLYSLGLVHIRLDQPLQAIDALERYLADTAIPIAPDRERVAREQLAEQQARVAFLKPRLDPVDASVQVEGRRLAARPDGRLALNPGVHDVRVLRDGYQSHQRRISLAPGESQPFEVRLEPGSVGRLLLSCPLPDVEVLVDDRAVATTPLSNPLELPAGEYRLRLRRPGYLEQSAEVSISEQNPAALTCRLPVDESEPRARLALEVSETGARVLLDGAAPPVDGLVPAGRHDLRVEREGFHPLKRQLLLEPGEFYPHQVVLLPTRDTLLQYRADAHRQRLWAYVAAGAGVVLGGGALGLHVWNDGRHDDYVVERDRLLGLGQSGTAPPADYVTQVNANNQELADIQNMDTVVIGLAATAGAALVTGVVLYLLGDDPYRYDGLPLPSEGAK